MELIPIIQSALLLFVGLLTVVIVTSYILSRVTKTRQLNVAPAVAAGHQVPASRMIRQEFIPLYPNSENRQYKEHLYSHPVNAPSGKREVYPAVNSSSHESQAYYSKESYPVRGHKERRQHNDNAQDMKWVAKNVQKNYSVQNAVSNNRFTVVNDNFFEEAAEIARMTTSKSTAARKNSVYVIDQPSEIYFK